MKIEDINDKKRILSNEEIESINSIQIIRPEGKELTFEEKCKINKYIQFMLNEEKNRSEVKIKKVKVLFGFSFGYAGIKDIKEIIVIDMTEDNYNDLQIKNNIIAKEYEEWLWNKIGNGSYWKEIECR